MLPAIEEPINAKAEQIRAKFQNRCSAQGNQQALSPTQFPTRKTDTS